MEVHIRPRPSHSNSFGNDAEKDTAGCRALNRKYIVIGEATYYIRAYDGYDSAGKQIERCTKWKPSPGMTEKQVEKELNKQMLAFEDKIKKGLFLT